MDRITNLPSTSYNKNIKKNKIYLFNKILFFFILFIEVLIKVKYPFSKHKNKTILLFKLIKSFPFCDPLGIIDDRLRFIYGIRGRKKLVVNDFSFYRFSSAKTSQMWYCSQRKPQKCRASVKLHMDGKWNIVIGDHNHAASKLYAPVHLLNDINEIYFDDDSDPLIADDGSLEK